MVTRRRLGLYIDSPLIGGAEQHFRDLLVGIDRAQYSVTVLGPAWDAFDQFLEEGGGPDFERVVVRTVHPGVTNTPVQTDHAALGQARTMSRARTVYRRLPVRHAIDPLVVSTLKYGPLALNMRRLARCLTDRPIDLLHIVNGGYPGASSAQAVAVAAAKVGVPVVLTACSMATAVCFPAAAERRLDAAVAAACRAVIVPGARSRAALHDLRGFPMELLRTIPWGVRAPSRPSSAQMRSAREVLGLPLDVPVLGMLANFTPTKGHLALVDAVALLRDAWPDLRVVMAGDGPMRDAVRARVADQRLSERVSVPGFLDDPYALYQAADLFVLPSEVEGLPYVVLEALSQGLPIVATDVGDMCEAVRPGRNGQLVPPRNATALAAAIDDLLSDKGRLAAYSDNARADYEETFSYEAMLRSHHALYRELVESGSG